MTYLDNERLKLISEILGEKANSSRTFTQYMSQKRHYGPEDALHMREAHFILALGPGEGKAMSELARVLSVTKGAVSQTAGRLEKKGCILRRPDPGNRRLVIAVLTEKGEEFYQRHLEFDRAEYAKMDRDYLSRFSEEELRLILEYEERMTALFAEAVAKKEEE